MENESNETASITSFGESRYKLPSDYTKYTLGEWSVDERAILVQDISYLRKLVYFLEFVISFRKENDRLPNIEELKEKKFEAFIISNFDTVDPNIPSMEFERILGPLKSKLIEKEKTLGEILVNAAVGMDENSLNDLVKKIKQVKEYNSGFNKGYADPVLGKVAMTLREFDLAEKSSLPTQEEFFKRIDLALSDKQKRRIKEVFGLVGVLPRKKRGQGFGGPQK